MECYNDLLIFYDPEYRDMRQSIQNASPKRQMTFKLAEGYNSASLYHVLDKYLESEKDIVFSGRLYIPGEGPFLQELSSIPCLVFPLESPNRLKLYSEENASVKRPVQKVMKRSSLWIQATKSSNAVRTRLSSISIRLRPRCHTHAPSIPAKDLSHIAFPQITSPYIDKVEEKGSGHQQLSSEKEKDLQLQPGSPPKNVTTPPELVEISTPVPTEHLLSPLPTPPISEPGSPLSRTSSLRPSRASSLIRGRDVPFPAVPINTQRRRSLPMLPNVGTSFPTHTSDTPEISRTSSYVPSKDPRPLPVKPDVRSSKAWDNDDEPPRGRSLRRKPLFAPPTPIFSATPSDMSTFLDTEKWKSIALGPMWGSRDSSLLRVPPFPLPHRLSQPRVPDNGKGVLVRSQETAPRRLPPIPSSAAVQVRPTTPADRRKSLKNRSSKRPAALKLVDDNTRLS